MMLPFLLPYASPVRASIQLPRRLRAIFIAQEHISRRSTSTSTSTRAPHIPLTARSDQDDAHNDVRPCNTIHDAAFSHFFDRQTPLDSTQARSVPGKLKASHEIVSASRHAVAMFRQAISTRDPYEIVQAYASLTRAQQQHAQDIRNSTSQSFHPAQIGFPVRKGDIQTAIRYLIQHGQSQGHLESRFVEACQRMFRDMSQTFGFRIGATDLHRQLQASCLSKSARYDPCEAFEQLRASHPDWQTTSVEWNMVISYLSRRRSYDRAIEVWRNMLALGVEPETSLRNTMIQVQLAVNNTAEVEAQLQHIRQESGSLGPDTLSTTVAGLCKVARSAAEPDQELMSKLRSFASQLRKTVEASPQAAMDTPAWHALLRYEALVAGPAEALETARHVRKPGLFDHRTVCMFLRLHVDQLRDLQSSDEALQLLDRVRAAIDPERTIEPDNQCYRILMLGLLNDLDGASADFIDLDDDAEFYLDEAGYSDKNKQQFRSLPTPNQVREAQLFYDHLRALGVPPTPLWVRPLLTAYCEAFLPSLPSAVRLVYDMLDVRSSQEPSTPQSTQGRSSIGMNIIRPVLDACIRLKDIPSARDLLARLHDAGITLSARNKSEMMCRLINITTSWPEAFQVYRSLLRFPTGSWSSSGSSMKGLDERGYTSLLEFFRALTFFDPKSPAGQQLPAPPEELLGIVEDMRAAGHRPSCAIYTSILDYYCKFPEPSYLGVKATHDMLKEDEGLEPDLPLINALMNAYNRTDEPAMVLAIWNSLIATRQEIDGVTASVFFDTAGRHGLLALARKAIATIRRIEGETDGTGGGRRSAMTKGAWDSWLECLARCGRLEEAIELVFGEMRKTLFRQAIALQDFDPSDDYARLSVNELVIESTQAPVKDKKGRIVGPDAKTVGTLLRFAAKERDRRQKRFGAVLPWSSTTPSNDSGGVDGGGTTVWHTLRARIREELSWLYPQVKYIGETPL